MNDISVPVLIVGGGGCGLASSIFLSRLGVESLLIERHAKPSPMPKARGLNRRTMEVFRQYGFADEVYARSVPATALTTIRWATSLGGDEPTDRITLYEMLTYRPELPIQDLSPCLPTMYPQVRLEPLMRTFADAHGPGRLLFDTELVGLEQDDQGVHVTARTRSTGEDVRIHAQYVIAADAGKTVGPLLGATSSGTPTLADMVTVYFKADLSAYVDNDRLVSFWFANPYGDPGSWGSGVLGKLGPDNHGRDSEEWMFHFNVDAELAEQLDESTLVPRIRELLKIPDFDPELLGVSHWLVRGVLADRYRFGRVFLAGDAAHQHTPTTGLGLNSAVQDAHNLTWKLALVLQGQATDRLLDSYESERRPIGKRNVDWALFTWSNHAITGAAIGLVPGDPVRSQANFAALLAPGDDGDTRRARFDEAMRTHRTEWQAYDLDIGFRYEHGAVVPDGSEPPPRDEWGHVYTPTGRPGHRLPHRWLSQGDAQTSTFDLVEPGVFTLFVASPAEPWREALDQVRERLPATTLVEVGDADGWVDTDGSWRTTVGIGPGGALLVRPDQHVAWRAAEPPRDPAAALMAAFRSITNPCVDLESQRRQVRPALDY